MRKLRRGDERERGGGGGGGGGETTTQLLTLQYWKSTCITVNHTAMDTHKGQRAGVLTFHASHSSALAAVFAVFAFSLHNQEKARFQWHNFR